MRLPSTSSKAGSSVSAYCSWPLSRGPRHCRLSGTKGPRHLPTRFYEAPLYLFRGYVRILLLFCLLDRQRGSRMCYTPALLSSCREEVFSAARCWDHDMTTYATTYRWRSTGVRRGLLTSPPEQNPLNGGRRGPTGLYGSADSITTNREGRRFESCRARQRKACNREIFAARSSSSLQ